MVLKPSLRRVRDMPAHTRCITFLLAWFHVGDVKPSFRYPEVVAEASSWIGFLSPGPVISAFVLFALLTLSLFRRNPKHHGLLATLIFHSF